MHIILAVAVILLKRIASIKHSVLLAEAIAQGSGYEAAFISQGAIGLVAAMILFCGVTLPSESQNKKPPSSDSENSSKDDDFDGVVDIQVS